jgi:hypothetical protein
MTLGWSGMTLAIDGRADVQRVATSSVAAVLCLRDAGRDGVRDAAAGGLRDPLIGLSGLSGIALALLMSLECTPSGREWSWPKATSPVRISGMEAAAFATSSVAAVLWPA